MVVKDASLLASMAVGDKVPSLALLVHVQQAMFHCGKSMIRSHMWEPGLWGPIDGLPTFGRVLVDHGGLERSVEEQERLADRNEKHRLYDGIEQPRTERGADPDRDRLTSWAPV